MVRILQGRLVSNMSLPKWNVNYSFSKYKELLTDEI